MFKKTFLHRKKSLDDGGGPKSYSGDDEPYDSNGASPNISIHPQPPSLFRWSHKTARSGYKSSTPKLLSNTEVGKSPADNPLGFEVIYRPPGEHKADIVFVHGLGGHSRKTWSKDNNPGSFWPLKWLPYEAGINEARISTFGYDANIGAHIGPYNNCMMLFLDFAKDLLYNLKYASHESEQGKKCFRIGERPIIFIAHSMGGLIVKEAYLQGQIDPEYKELINSVSSIIFFSTPHRGMDMARTLNKVLKVTAGNSPKQFIADLVPGSETLRSLNDRFRHVALDLKIVSFYETRQTAMGVAKIMVLERDSSVLGYPGEISKPLDADHHGVCKFDGPNDLNYVSVRNVIQSLIKSYEPNLTLAEGVQESSVHDVSFDFEGYLSAPESPERDYNFFRDRWTPGTCNWILKNATFNDWLQDTRRNPRVLWINGNAASGKSILSSFVINHMAQLGRPCQYFFIRFENNKKRTLNNMMRSLACQLARSIPEYAENLRQLQVTGTDLKTADYQSLWLWLYQKSLITLTIKCPLFWIIDGLDEADNPESIVRVLSKLYSATIPIRVLVVSRPTHEISSSFQKLQKQIHSDKIHIEGNHEDFLSYIRNEMDLAGEPSYREGIIRQILERAQGNFLWARFAVEKINKCHTRLDVKAALNGLPLGMEGLYDRMVGSIQTQPKPSNKMLAKIILCWATCSQRSLSVDELRDALGKDSPLDIYRAINDLCGGFVVVDNEDKVSMVHATAVEYLFQKDRVEEHQFVIDRKVANDELFKSCILCLMDPKLRSQVNRNDPPVFLDYAMNFWSVHLAHGSSTETNVLMLLFKFLQEPHVLTWISIAAKRKELRGLIDAPRRMVAIANMLSKLYIEDANAIEQHKAIELLTSWATDLVNIVGKFGSYLTKDPDSIYKLIPPFCPENSAIYRQFGWMEMQTLSVFGSSTNETWDECLACFSFGPNDDADSILATGNHIAIVVHKSPSSHIYLYNSITFREERQLIHPEWVHEIKAGQMGENLISYGREAVKVWQISTGECIKTINNPANNPIPQAILFNDQLNRILVSGKDRCIRSLDINDGDSAEWKMVTNITDWSPDEAKFKEPICSAFSPDGNMIAFGYSGHMVTVWETQRRKAVSQLSMKFHKENMTIPKYIDGEVDNLMWHPSSGEIIGLQRDGLLFKWDPYDDESIIKVRVEQAYRLAISRDGSRLATGDGEHVIKIFVTADLSLLHSLSTQGSIRSLSFSTNSRRVYDVRGKYGNVWEPSVLVDPTSAGGALAHKGEYQISRAQNITTVCGQSAAPIYCYGTENGPAMLREVGSRAVWELENGSDNVPIHKLALSENGNLAAIADMSGKVSIKTISRDGRESGDILVHHDFAIQIGRSNGVISRLLFHPGGGQLFVDTIRAIYTVNIATHAVVSSILVRRMEKTQWICHPTNSDYILGFSDTLAYVLNWDNLEDVETVQYFPPRQELHPKSSSYKVIHSQENSARVSEDQQPLNSKTKVPDILLEISHYDPLGQHERVHLGFSVADIKVGRDHGDDLVGDTQIPSNKLPYTILPQDLTSRIREPLALLSHGRLIFLDTEQWICAWVVSSVATEASQAHNISKREALPPAVSGGPQAVSKDQQETDRNVDKYYFLPADWVTLGNSQACSIMRDGTLLCPVRGNISTVQCARLRTYFSS